MKSLVCQFNLFDINQKIYIFEDKRSSGIKVAAMAPLDQIGKTIATLGASEGINHAHIIGQESYAQGIADDIREYNTKIYGNRNMTIEVN